MSGNGKIFLATPRGYCAGVRRALIIVEKALKKYGPPIFVHHQIVHNEHVVEELERRRVVFIEKLDSVPADRPLIISAHGAAPAVFEHAAELGIKHIIDATCPLVAKIHREAERAGSAGRAVILVGHRRHPEAVGTIAHAKKPAFIVENAADVDNIEIPAGQPVTCLCQTTFSHDAYRRTADSIRKRFPDSDLIFRDDICYASRERQNAVKHLAAKCQLVLVIGSPNSSNSKRLVELARGAGAEAALIGSANDINAASLAGVGVIGVSAGASAPEYLTESVVEKLRAWGWDPAGEIGGGVDDTEFPAELP